MKKAGKNVFFKQNYRVDGVKENRFVYNTENNIEFGVS